MSSDSEKLLSEVSIWLVRLERGLKPHEGSQLREWLRDPARRAAIVDAAKLHHGPDIVAVLADLVPVGFGTPLPPVRRRLSPVKVAIAVCIGVVAVAPLLMIRHHMRGVLENHYRPLDPVLPWGEQAYGTKPGETRVIHLADGTRLTLNGHSQVVVTFSLGARLASLKYGEAMFDIEHARERPFDIDAAGRHLHAPLGKFDVRVLSPQAAELTVLTGSVTVQGLPWRWPATPAEARLFDPREFKDTLVGPMQATILQDGSVSRYPITADNVRTHLSWEPQEIVYVTP